MILCYLYKKHKRRVLPLKKSIFTFNSITYAIKAQRLLSKKTIRSKLIKLDSSEDESGCKYGLEISSADLYSAVSVLRSVDFEYKVRDGNGLP